MLGGSDKISDVLVSPSRVRIVGSPSETGRKGEDGGILDGIVDIFKPLRTFHLTDALFLCTDILSR